MNCAPTSSEYSVPIVVFSECSLYLIYEKHIHPKKLFDVKITVCWHYMLAPLCKLSSFGLIIVLQVLNFRYLIRKHENHLFQYFLHSRIGDRQTAICSKVTENASIDLV